MWKNHLIILIYVNYKYIFHQQKKIKQKKFHQIFQSKRKNIYFNLINNSIK
jgi:hypothetical protein